MVFMLVYIDTASAVKSWAEGGRFRVERSDLSAKVSLKYDGCTLAAICSLLSTHLPRLKVGVPGQEMIGRVSHGFLCIFID